MVHAKETSSSIPAETNVCTCTNPVAPNTSVTTANCIQVKVLSTFVDLMRTEAQSKKYQWNYQVHLTNHGYDTVQLLESHWRFTDIEGAVHDIKSPGGSGTTPILHPGDAWSYKATATLKTSTGAMKGMFKLDVLDFGNSNDGNSDGGGDGDGGGGACVGACGRGTGSSSGRSSSQSLKPTSTTPLLDASIVACRAIAAATTQNSPSKRVESLYIEVPRISLTDHANNAINVPCEDSTRQHWLSTASLRSTKRIIVGATCTYLPIPSNPSQTQYLYQYNVVIHNAHATQSIRIVAHEWTFERLANDIEYSNAPVLSNTLKRNGLGGYQNIDTAIHIQPNRSYRYAGQFALVSRNNVVSGVLKANLMGAVAGGTGGNGGGQIDIAIDAMACNTAGTLMKPMK